MKFRIALVIGLSWAALGMAQTFLETQKGASAPTFPEFQRRLHEWSLQAGPQKPKGWKWLKRWEDFETQRMSPDGSLHDRGLLVEAASAVAAHCFDKPSNSS